MRKNLNVLLVQPPAPETIDKEYVSTQMPINLCYIGAVLEKEGANVKIVDFCVEKFEKEKLIDLLKEFKPEIVGTTSMTPSINSVKEIMKAVKGFDKEILTMLGGIHISALPGKTMEEMKEVDVGVVGEGEETIREVYRLKKEDKEIKNVKGIVYRSRGKIKVNERRELIKNLDEIPFPARYLLKTEKYDKSHVSRGFSRKRLRIMEIITSRGCPNRCVFCAGHINYGYNVRFRSFENIREEIELLIREYKIKHLSIEDDTFTLNRELVEKLCPYLKERKISWNCNTRVNTVDFELLKLMKESGCRKVSFGVESGSQRMLKLIKKNITLEQVRNSFRWAKKAGIRYVEGTFILGSHHDEKMEDIRETEKLIFELMPDFLMLSIVCPYPGTELYEEMIKEGLMEENPKWENFTFIPDKTPFKKLKHIEAEELLKKQKEIIKRYYSSPKYVLKQVRKIRSFGEAMYFLNLGRCFLTDFVMKRKD